MEQKKFFPVWVTVLVISLLGFFVNLMACVIEITSGPSIEWDVIHAVVLAPFFVVAAILVILWAVYARKRKKKIDTVNEPSYPKPVYINEQNYSEYSDLLVPVTNDHVD